LTSLALTKALNECAFAQSLQCSIEMMSSVSQRFVQFLADFPQAQAFEIKQPQRLSLNFRELRKRFLQLHPVEFRRDLAIQVGLSR
jgi:hypothetical protein